MSKKYLIKDISFKVFKNAKNIENDVDAIIFNKSKINNSEVINIIERFINPDLPIAIENEDIPVIFGNSGIWEYDYTPLVKEKELVLEFKNKYKKSFEILTLIETGKNISLSYIEDILENIKGDNEDVCMIFGFGVNNDLKENEINVHIYNRISKNEVINE